MTGDERKLQRFMSALIADVNALDHMLDSDLFERDVRRIGCELELFFVDADQRPAPIAGDVLARVADARLTHELATFNAEINGTPRLLEQTCLRDLERELADVLAAVAEAASASGAVPVLTGILPTLTRQDLSLENMTPYERYRSLNQVAKRLRGGAFSLSIQGLEQLHVTHDNVLLEACTTSFQLHYQVAPADFARMYNIAQVATAPVLAAAVNSPLLFGRRLWRETRLALFERTVDMRSKAETNRGTPSRVSFGAHWLRGSVTEIFKEQIARYRVVLPAEADSDPMAEIAAGRPPALTALRMHNGTVWRWNRACYGVADGRAHLRIENRVLPAGPSLVDQVANAAFFYGLLLGMDTAIGDVTERMVFADAKQNFHSAARDGLGTQLTWLDGRTATAPDLIEAELLPMARAGLQSAQVDGADTDRYLGIIADRVRTRRTGAKWFLMSLDQMRQRSPRDVRHRRLVAELARLQATGLPVHEWPLAELPPDQDWSRTIRRVDQFMTRDLFTVRPHDSVDLIASVMDWQHVEHVPVEDDDGALLGIVTGRALLRLLARGTPDPECSARDIMKTDPVTVAPTATTLEVMQVMREHGVGCLPVLDDGRLVGMVTQTDLIRVTAPLLVAALRDDESR